MLILSWKSSEILFTSIYLATKMTHCLYRGILLTFHCSMRNQKKRYFVEIHAEFITLSFLIFASYMYMAQGMLINSHSDGTTQRRENTTFKAAKRKCWGQSHIGHAWYLRYLIILIPNHRKAYRNSVTYRAATNKNTLVPTEETDQLVKMCHQISLLCYHKHWMTYEETLNVKHEVLEQSVQERKMIWGFV